MKHSEIRKLMPDYLEGDLDLDKRALFDAHLDECAECASDIDGMRQTLSLLHTLSNPEPPPDLSRRIMRRIEDGETRRGWRERLEGVFGPLLEPRVLAPISAGALVLGLLWGTTEFRLIEDGQEQPGPAGGIAMATGDRMTGQSSPIPSSPQRVVIVNDEAMLDRGSLARLTPQQEMVALSRLLASTSPLGKIRLEVRPHPPLVAQPGLGFSQSPPEMETVAMNQAALGAPGLGSIGSAPVRLSRSNQPSADEWLARLQSDSSGFASRLSATSLAEQELWVKYLAKRALEQDSLNQVLDSLRSSPSRHARLLADDFEAAARR